VTAASPDQLARPAVTPETLRELYTIMRRINVLENEILQALSSGRLRTPFYPVRGLEPACAAIGTVLDAEDYLVSTYRCIGDVIAKGVPLREITAELFGRASGMSKGKGGAMHMAAPHHGLMATTGVVGAGLPIAAGLGLAAKLQETGRVTVTTFGDGATSIGAFHESMNLASAWQLPVVFVCQNNQWGEHTNISAYTRNPRLADRAEALGMRAMRVDGFDTLAVYEAMRDAVAVARAGDGPVFLESVTYRLRPHAFGADESYIPPDDRARALERDPVPAFRNQLRDGGQVPAGDLDAIDERVDAEIADAIRFAESADPTPAEEMQRDVYDLDGGAIAS
jgi:pyruvate dehydrogenase E1 component alpha subunit